MRAHILHWLRKVEAVLLKGAPAGLDPISHSSAGDVHTAIDGCWVPTHRHRKGGLYRVLGEGILESDRKIAVIYQDAQGSIWIRSKSEFEDGRFERYDGVDNL